MQQRPDFLPFELEEWQSRYEMTVKYNLADSGCHPVRLSELVSDPSAVLAMLNLDLHYPAVGEPPLYSFPAASEMISTEEHSTGLFVSFGQRLMVSAATSSLAGFQIASALNSTLINAI